MSWGGEIAIIGKRSQWDEFLSRLKYVQSLSPHHENKKIIIIIKTGRLKKQTSIQNTFLQ